MSSVILRFYGVLSEKPRVCAVGAAGEPNPLCAGELVLDIGAGVDYNINVAFAIVAELAYAHV